MHLLWTPLWLQNAFIYLSMESFFVKNDSRCNLSYIPLKWYLTRIMSTALLVLTLLSWPLKALKNCCTIIDYFEAKDVIIIKNSLFPFSTRNQLHVKILYENFYNDGIINHSWPNYEVLLIRSTWIIISVNCYSVTYELTYHHFPNPIESVGKSVLSSPFTPYPWLTSLILYRMLEKRCQGALLSS